MTSVRAATGCSPRAQRARWKTVALLGAALLFAGVPAGAAAEESPEGACPVLAAAQGVQIMVSASDNLLLAAPAGAGIPSAQACVDYGVRDSSAFASSPYPGETVIIAPGLLSSRTGQDIPPYPAYAASRHPAKEHSEVEQPGFSLRASSTETVSEARARTAAGPDDTDAGSTLATTRSTVDPATKGATATATSDTQPVTIADVLRLGQVHSTASAKVGADGKLQRSSDLRVGRTTVAGQEVVITPDGLRAADQQVALPGERPADALEAAGVSVRYLTAEQTPGGVLSAGIEVVWRQEDPESGSVTTVHYTFGRSYAAAAPAQGDAGALPVAPLPPVGAPGPAAPPADGGPAGSGPAGSGPAAVDDAAASGEAPESSEVPAGSEAPPPGVAAADRLVANPIDMGVTGFYLVLVFGALAMVVAGTLLRLLGVKTRWTS